MIQTRDRDLPEGAPSLVPLARAWVAREQARCGDRDAAIPVIREAARQLYEEERIGWAVGVSDILVTTLLERGGRVDLAEAHGAIDQLANLPDAGAGIQELTLLRLRTLLARADGDLVGYRSLLSRHYELAKSLGFEGHLAWAAAMPAT